MKFFLIRIEMHIRSYLEIQKKKKCIVFFKKVNFARLNDLNYDIKLGF